MKREPEVTSQRGYAWSGIWPPYWPLMLAVALVLLGLSALAASGALPVSPEPSLTTPQLFVNAEPAPAAPIPFDATSGPSGLLKAISDRLELATQPARTRFWAEPSSPVHSPRPL